MMKASENYTSKWKMSLFMAWRNYHWVYCCDIQNIEEIGFRMPCIYNRVLKCSSPYYKVAKCLHMT